MPLLADEIAQLLNPKPSQDVADEDDGHAAFAGRSAVVDPGIPKSTPSKERTAGRRMRAAVSLEGADAVKYAGRRISRKELEKSYSGNTGRQVANGNTEIQDGEVSPDSGVEDALDEDSVIDLGDDYGDEGSAGGDGEEDASGGSDIANDDDESVASDESKSGDGEREHGRHSAQPRAQNSSQKRASGAAEESLFEQWEALQSQEADLAAHLHASRAQEMQQAREARKQHNVWLQLMQTRLKMQPAMAAAAKWPSASESVLWGATDACRAKAGEAADGVAALLCDLNTLRAALLNSYCAGSDESMRSTSEVLPADAAHWQALGSDVDSWWQALEAADAAAAPLIEQWVGESSAAVQAGASLRAERQFTTVRQGVLQQVEHMLAQLPLGSQLREEKCHQQSERVLGKRAKPDEDAAAQGAEVYNDADFYHALLRELLDDGNDNMPTALVAPKLKSKKRKTDNRQSKGRKLSYDVQPQLQNFMFPVIPERPVVLSELFSSVFGTSTSMAPPKAVKQSSSTNQLTNGTTDHAEDEVLYSNLFQA